MAIASLDSSMHLITAGGILERDHEKSRRLHKRSVAAIRAVLGENGTLRDRVEYPPDGLPGTLTGSGRPYFYLQDINQSLLQVSRFRNQGFLPSTYSFPGDYRGNLDDTYSHLLVFSSVGAVGTEGYQTATMARFAVALALGNLTVPMTSMGYGSVMIFDLEENRLVYFSTTIEPPGHVELTEKERVDELFKTLLAPYLQALREEKSGNVSRENSS